MGVEMEKDKRKGAEMRDEDLNASIVYRDRHSFKSVIVVRRKFHLKTSCVRGYVKVLKTC